MYCFLYPFFCFFLLRFSNTFFQNFLNLSFVSYSFYLLYVRPSFVFYPFVFCPFTLLSFVPLFFVFCSLSFVPCFALYLLSFAHFCSYIRTVFLITNIRSHILLYLAKNVNPQINIFYRKYCPDACRLLYCKTLNWLLFNLMLYLSRSYPVLHGFFKRFYSSKALKKGICSYAF